MRVLARVAAAAAVVSLVASSAASASQLIDRNATDVKLSVDTNGRAIVTYKARRGVQHVLAWGAIDALAPTRARPQVRFRLDYSGGSRRWKGFENSCRPYDGPHLAWFVAGCQATDGSFWALQSWQRLLPNYGADPRATAWELHLSHWRGELPVFTVRLDWAYRSFDHLYGSLMYRGRPVYGFSSSASGSPLDSYGRNVYLDTYNSAYGGGWLRENGFLLHNPTGAFCYGLYPHRSRPSGKGERYRATVIGPGVTPDLFWESAAPGPYDRALDVVANRQLRDLGDRRCRPS